MAKRLVLVAGNIGAGKTSITEKLAFSFRMGWVYCPVKRGEKNKAGFVLCF